MRNRGKDRTNQGSWREKKGHGNFDNQKLKRIMSQEGEGQRQPLNYILTISSLKLRIVIVTGLPQVMKTIIVKICHYSISSELKTLS